MRLATLIDSTGIEDKRVLECMLVNTGFEKNGTKYVLKENSGYLNPIYDDICDDCGTEIVKTCPDCGRPVHDDSFVQNLVCFIIMLLKLVKTAF
jgi:hypothetical protein